MCIFAQEKVINNFVLTIKFYIFEMKTFSTEQMMFAKKTLIGLVHNRGAIITVNAEKSKEKSGYNKVYSNITLGEDETSAMDTFFFNRFHQHLTYRVKSGTIEFTIV